MWKTAKKQEFGNLYDSTDVFLPPCLLLLEIFKGSQPNKNGTLVGVYSTKASPLKTLDFSLDVAVRVIEFYEDYYGVKYPIPQSPSYSLTSSGAMENWGW